MQLYLLIDEKTGFKKGDIIVKSIEVCTSCDGDRSSFTSYMKTLVLRPIDPAVATEKRKG